MSVQSKFKDFYSLHGIWGADSSLALGRIGRGAGMVTGNVQPPERALFAGYQTGNERPVLLPFAPNVQVGLGVDAFVADTQPSDLPNGTPRPVQISCFGDADIRRSLSMSGEEWQAGSLTMTVTSFFGDMPDPSSCDRATLRKRMCPAIYVTMSFDNTKGSAPMTGIFGMQGIHRTLSDSTSGALLGFAHPQDWGFAILPGDGIDAVMDWRAVPSAFSEKPQAFRRLASEGCLRFRIPAREKRDYVIAVGVYRDGIITSGIKARLFQSELFGDIEDVLTTALSEAAERLAVAARLDGELNAASISDDRKFLIAHAAHSYNSSTELLVDETGAPLFVVNEGEYQMMNTLDLTIDQAFHELHYSPWTVRNELDFFVSRYSYSDRYGLAFTHDQGVEDGFTPQGTSSYELTNLTGCFSFMSYEETLNWILTACLYGHNTGDTAWFARTAACFADAVESILARDRNGDGIMDADSDRCESGSEITTYDSLDASLGQARNNLYIAVKAWAALVCAASLMENNIAPAGTQSVNSRGSNAKLAELVIRARAEAAKAAVTIVSRMDTAEGYIPAVFEGGNTSRIIPAVEGLVYPAFCGAADATLASGPYGKLILALKKHLDTVLAPGVCLDPVSGGWKLSSTSRNTWPSKIFISQYVAENVLGFTDERTKRDAATVHWQCNGSADWAATDQVDSSSGKDLGSRLYPRLVSSILWLHPPVSRRS